MRRALPLLAVAALAVALLTILPGFWTNARDIPSELGIPSTQQAPTVGPVITEDGNPDYDAWRRDAERARRLVARALASDESFDALRSLLSDWASVFNAEARRYTSPVNVLELQIAALGPPPEAGASEPDAIAARRADLEEQLQAVRVPLLIAEVAATEASGYVAEIDVIVRERRAARLVSRGPSILNPANWVAAAGEFVTMGRIAREDLASSWNNRLSRELRQQRAPAILLMSILGTVMMVSGGRLVGRVLPRRAPPSNRTAAELRWILLQLGRLIIRMIGLVLIVGALQLLELNGARAAGPVEVVSAVGAILLVARALAVSLFGKQPEAPRLFQFSHAHRGSLRRSALWLGIALAIGVALEMVGANMGAQNADSAAVVVLTAPLLIVTGLLLLRNGRLLQQQPDDPERPPSTDADIHSGEARQRSRTLAIVSAFVRLAGIGTVILAVAGYYEAAELLVYSTIGSLALGSALLLLQRLVIGTLTLALERRGAELGGAAGLIPILSGFALIVLAMPLFALIWGVRWTVLVDLWRDLSDGVTLGGITFTLENIVVFFTVFVLGYILTGLTKGALSNTILPRTRLDLGARDALVTGAGYLGIIVTAILAVTMAGIDLTGLAFVAGALSVGIGFGLRTIVENFVSGIILLVERPIKQGDWIEVGGDMGYVRQISVRSTRIETFDRSDVILPNADLVAGKVTNYTYNNAIGRLILPVGVAYGSDIDKVKQVLREVAEDNPMVILQPPPSVLFRGFGDSALDFEIRAILRDVNSMLSVQTEMNTAIARRFAEEGIEIPFPQRDLWLRNPEALRPVPGRAEPGDQNPRPEDLNQLPEPEPDAAADMDGDTR
jgi:potassium efflux system protein